MRPPSIQSFVLMLPLVLGACAVQSAATLPVPRQRASECRDVCAELGMEMTAVVVVMNHAGCVCQPNGTSAAAAGGVTVASAAVIATAEEAARREQEEAEHRRREEDARRQRDAQAAEQSRQR